MSDAKHVDNDRLFNSFVCVLSLVAAGLSGYGITLSIRNIHSGDPRAIYYLFFGFLPLSIFYLIVSVFFGFRAINGDQP